VAWVAERKDVLSALFWILAMGAWERYARRPSRGRYLPVVLLMALGLAAKPMGITLPFVLLLLDV
jgi:4-amino-4-deoxy-L-arabinose transferase-like glycosyltransferase